MFTEAHGHRLSHIKYASAGADGKAVTSEAPVWASHFSDGYRDAVAERGKVKLKKNALIGHMNNKSKANKSKRLFWVFSPI